MNDILRFQGAFLDFAADVFDALHPIEKQLDITGIATGLASFSYACFSVMLDGERALDPEGLANELAMQSTIELEYALADVLCQMAEPRGWTRTWNDAAGAFNQIAAGFERFGGPFQQFAETIVDWQRGKYQKSVSCNVIAPIYGLAFRGGEPDFVLAGHAGIHTDGAMRSLLKPFFPRQHWDIRDLNLVHLRDLSAQIGQNLWRGGSELGNDPVQLFTYTVAIISETYKRAKYESLFGNDNPEEAGRRVALHAKSMMHETGALIYEALHRHEFSRTYDDHFDALGHYGSEWGRAYSEACRDLSPPLRDLVAHYLNPVATSEGLTLEENLFGAVLHNITGHLPEDRELLGDIELQHKIIQQRFVLGALDDFHSADDSALLEEEE